MRFRFALWAFALGAVVGASAVLTWMTGDFAPNNRAHFAPVSAQFSVVEPDDVRRDVKPVPRDWQPREFNGKTYYVIPLNAA
ncbi:MAG TPA: hypothetical protein VHD36_02115 [Pirellulales bacterium]|nr:hypothetical protein [Pirellulales bacterium]